MARGRQQRSYTHEEAQDKADWFKSSNASVESIGDWDLKPQLVEQAVLGALSQGVAIMFSAALSGRAVSITIFDGDAKSRVYATDTIELEDALLKIIDRTRPKLRAVQAGG